MTVEPWFVAEALSKRYGGVQAVSEAGIAMRQGEVRGLIGANGAGKSTFVQMLTGQLRPDSGSIRVDGVEMSLTGRTSNRLAAVELMPQELAVLPNLSVAANVVLGREPRRRALLDFRVQNERARAALAKVGLEDVDLATPAHRLSLVQQRLLMAARAVMSGSRLIILDEPTAAMSPAEVALLLEMVTALSKAGVSCLYVSHRLDEIIELADTVTAMRDGRVVEELEAGGISHARLVELITTAAPALDKPTARADLVPGPAVLEVDRVSGRGLTDVSFSVGKGEIVGLAGLVASGANDVLDVVSGSRRQDAGTIRLDGTLLRPGRRQEAARAGVGYLPGDRTLAVLPNHRVRENVTIASLDSYTRLGLPGPKRERAGISGALRGVGYTRDTEITISTLSGGNQQKTLLARWAVERLRLLLLDDPTVGVDIGARAEIHDALRQLAASGVSVLLYSSDVDELISLSDRVIILDRGSCVAELHQPHVTAEEVLHAMTGATAGLSAG
jgi:ABC-type sugar transport system ATPase subunit